MQLLLKKQQLFITLYISQWLKSDFGSFEIGWPSSAFSTFEVEASLICLMKINRTASRAH